MAQIWPKKGQKWPFLALFERTLLLSSRKRLNRCFRPSWGMAQEAIFGPLFGSILGPLFGPLLARFRLEVPSFPAWRGSHFGTQKWPKNGSKTNQNGPVSMDVIFPYRRAPRGRGPNPQKRGFWAILCVISSMGPPRAPTPESGGPDLIPGEGWKCQKGPFFGSFLDPFWAIFGTPIWRYWPRSHRPSSVYGPKGAKKGSQNGPKKGPKNGPFWPPGRPK